MEAGVYIFVDEDFERPLYGEPTPDEVEPALWEALCEAVHEAVDGDRARQGHGSAGGRRFAWHVAVKTGLAFVVTVPGRVAANATTSYLSSLVERYFDEVDDVRRPDRDGVEDVIIDVVAPWEDDEED